MSPITFLRRKPSPWVHNLERSSKVKHPVNLMQGLTIEFIYKKFGRLPTLRIRFRSKRSTLRLLDYFPFTALIKDAS